MNKSKERIVVIGAGWLGLSLANYLKEKKFNVIGTYRTITKQRALIEHGIEAKAFCLGNDPQIVSETKGATCYVMNIPFGKQGEEKVLFELRMKQLFSSLLKNTQNHLIFISTTSVYGNQEGIIDERSSVRPSTESAKVHVELEAYLEENWLTRSTILRLSGLVGGGRHPIYSLAKKEQIKQSNWPVNLIHRDDVVRACEQIIVQGLWGKTLVLNCLEHPIKEEYYAWAATKCDLKCPAMQSDVTSIGKKVNSKESWKALGIQPLYPTPYDML